MKHELGILGLACLALACQGTGERAPAREAAPPADPSDPVVMERMLALGTPGEPHAALAATAGRWSVEIRMPNAPGGPQAATATAERRMLLGGRLLQEDFRGEMMGMPFEGMALVGYDNLAEEYYSIWFDTWSTGAAWTRGRENASGEIVLEGLMKDALTPEGRPFRHVSRTVGPDEERVELYDTLPDGTEQLVMAMVYRRVRG